MMDWNPLRAQQVLAMHRVLKPDAEYLLRRIYRYYSQHFHTPLHVVEELPLDDVLCHYYEHLYENMESGSREILREKLALTMEELLALAKSKQEDEEDDSEWLREIEEQEKRRIAQTGKGESPEVPAVKDEWETVAGSAPPPEIKMSFLKERDFDDYIKGLEQEP